MEKKVVQILGTVRSGTTYLGLTIGSQFKNSVCLGEVYPLFKPLRSEHYEKRAELIRNDERWGELLKGSPKKFYSNFFSVFPEVDVIVDSSKEPIWYYLSSKEVVDYKLYRVLVYKEFKELIISFSKRMSSATGVVYLKYHKKVFNVLGSDFYTIRLRDIRKEYDLRDFLFSVFREKLVIKMEIRNDLLKYNFFGSDTLFNQELSSIKRHNIEFQENHSCLKVEQLLDSGNFILKRDKATKIGPKVLSQDRLAILLIYLKDYLLRW